MPPARVPPAARVLVDHLGDGAAAARAAGRPRGAGSPASSRLRAFVDANRDKIRKKVRLATSDDARLDLWAELRVATRLLADRRIELAFEAYGAGNRGPDFTATYRAGPRRSTSRSRAATAQPPTAWSGRSSPSCASSRRAGRTSSSSRSTAPVGAPPDPAPMLRDLRIRADRREDAWFAAHGVADAAAFHQGVLRLSAVIAWTEPPGRTRRSPSTWSNAGARIAHGAGDPAGGRRPRWATGRPERRAYSSPDRAAATAKPRTVASPASVPGLLDGLGRHRVDDHREQRPGRERLDQRAVRARARTRRRSRCPRRAPTGPRSRPTSA